MFYVSYWATRLTGLHVLPSYRLHVLLGYMSYRATGWGMVFRLYVLPGYRLWDGVRAICPTGLQAGGWCEGYMSYRATGWGMV
jgi:hypothetical protein